MHRADKILMRRSEKVENQVLPEQIMEQFAGSCKPGEFADIMVVGGGVSGIQASLDLGGVEVVMTFDHGDAAPCV
jgi:heterodisulfide reductase subunit A-like polyferredoxin